MAGHLKSKSKSKSKINLASVLMRVVGPWRSQAFFGIGLFVFFLLLRSLFLGTLENPQPRYSLEGYPALLVLAPGFFRSASINFHDVELTNSVLNNSISR